MTGREQRVTPLELFFDLVFVYAITQVTALMSHDLTWRGLGRGLLVLAALWWAWTGYAWLTNTLEPEEGKVRAGMFGGMAAMLVAALAVPDAFGAEAVLFGVAFVLVRLVNLALYGVAGATARVPPRPRAVRADGGDRPPDHPGCWFHRRSRPGSAVGDRDRGALLGSPDRPWTGPADLTGALRRAVRADRDHRPRRVGHRDRLRGRRRRRHEGVHRCGRPGPRRDRRGSSCSPSVWRS